jgi:hypothetical protein
MSDPSADPDPGAHIKLIGRQKVDFATTQHYCCVMIPPFVNIGGPWEVLPPGIHSASLREVEKRFSTNPYRRSLFDGFGRATQTLRAGGCRLVYLDGSFITDKPLPGDFDACWDSVGVDLKKIDPVLLDFTNLRRAQKTKYLGELFPANVRATPSSVFIDFFQIDKYTGKTKGIIQIHL